jgi:hypothetical protein
MNRRTRTVALAAVSLAALLGACSSARTDGARTDGGAKGTVLLGGGKVYQIDSRYEPTSDVPVYDTPGDITMAPKEGPVLSVQQVESGPNAIGKLPPGSEVAILCQSTATRYWPLSAMDADGGSILSDFLPDLPRERYTKVPLGYFQIEYGDGIGYVVMQSLMIAGRSTGISTDPNTAPSDIKAC